MALQLIAWLITLMASSLYFSSPPSDYVGTWQLDAFRCSEIYEFHEDGSLTIRSRDEVTHHLWSIYPARMGNGISKRWDVLELITLSDNGQPDCAGSTHDNSGNRDIIKVSLSLNHRSLLHCNRNSTDCWSLHRIN